MSWSQLVEGGREYVRAVLGEGGTVKDAEGLAVYTAKNHPDRAADHFWKANPGTANLSDFSNIGDWPKEAG